MWAVFYINNESLTSGLKDYKGQPTVVDTTEREQTLKTGCFLGVSQLENLTEKHNSGMT